MAQAILAQVTPFIVSSIQASSSHVAASMTSKQKKELAEKKILKEATKAKRVKARGESTSLLDNEILDESGGIGVVDVKTRQLTEAQLVSKSMKVTLSTIDFYFYFD